ncbi:hypothetical protein GCM10023189_39170 [Nibrella saemangeumensis]|uniref:Uncharacterized protein n=1 Tax=Nibrella saemangeumensis TaxID=1084526 RepID=A0ABP8N9X6_9BACT
MDWSNTIFAPGNPSTARFDMSFLSLLTASGSAVLQAKTAIHKTSIKRKEELKNNLEVRCSKKCSVELMRLVGL